MKSVWGCLLFAGLALLTGCVTPKVVRASGGDRAAGLVDLSFQSGIREKPRFSTRQALDAARAQCRAWGYTDAEPFGGRRGNCERMGRGGCELTTVTIPYKCTGGAAVR